MTAPIPPSPPVVQALAGLLDLERKARSAASTQELAFLLVNESHSLTPYRQAAFWLAGQGVHTLSGVLQPEANAPYVHWLKRLCEHLSKSTSAEASTQALTAASLPAELAQEWADWWPAHALWLAMPAAAATSGGPTPEPPQAGVLLVRDEPWPRDTQALLREWVNAWWHAFTALGRPRAQGWSGLFSGIRRHFSAKPAQPWWQQNRIRWALAVVALLALPVRLTVLAPGELVPANPWVIRAPLDGVVDVFHVQPNQDVKKDQPLFGFDEALIKSRLDVAEQNLATAETEYRQTTQQALVDPKYRTQLAMLTGKIEERRAEVAYLREQFNRSRVVSPGDGVALFDDPSEWVGKPVAVGERIMRVAKPDDAEVEVWLPIADAIAFGSDTPVTLYLNASPLSPIDATLRYMAHEAVQRPDGQYAYRIRATLAETTSHRVGMKGTAKLHGGWVPMAYWVFRRPWAWLRTNLGV